MWNFLTIGPLIIGDLFPQNDPIWKTFIDFVDIVKRLFAPRFTKEHLIDLKRSIVNFNKTYFLTFPIENLKPKCHFLEHYHLHIQKFGPLVKTLRFESKHSYFKYAVANSRNNINICKSMATHHQMMMYLHYKEQEYFNEEATPVSIKEKLLQDIPEVERDKIKIENPCVESVIEANGVIWRSQRYYTGVGVVINGDYSYTFAEIEKVYLICGVPYLYCEELKILMFDTHIHAYKVKRTSKFYLVKLRELYDYHPLGIYSLSNASFIPLRHHIS